jgi:hypothetical protein
MRRAGQGNVIEGQKFGGAAVFARHRFLEMANLIDFSELS